MSVTFPEKSIFICDGKKCGQHKDVRKQLKEVIKEHHLKDRIEIFKIECSDRCKHAPVLCVQPANRWYSDITVKDTEQIINDLLK